MTEKKQALWLRIYAVVAFLYIYVPIVVLMVFSFNTQKLNISWHGFTWHWYQVLFRDDQVRLATGNTWAKCLWSLERSMVLKMLSSEARNNARLAISIALSCPGITP